MQYALGAAAIVGWVLGITLWWRGRTSASIAVVSASWALAIALIVLGFPMAALLMILAILPRLGTSAWDRGERTKALVYLVVGVITLALAIIVSQ
jgi:hypothetical protein